MSESSIASAAVPLQRRQSFLIAVVLVIALGVGYLAGYFMLPSMIRSGFDEHDCELVLSRGNIYARYYPFASGELGRLIQECAVFKLALNHEGENAWRDAYHAFTVYSESFPQGKFAAEVDEHLGAVLMGLAREEMAQKNHARALELLDRVVRDYDDPVMEKEAKALKLDLYMDWGASLREAGNFGDAERVFNEVRNSSDATYAKPSQLELAQTYLAWGLALQSQQQFGEAQAMIDVAISTDPDAQSSSGPAAQARANQVELYTQWGDHLVEQGDYANAMGHFATASDLLAAEDATAAKEIVAKGYIRWAETLSAKEDFLGALVLLDFAQANAASDATKTMVGDARSSVYLAFSESDGEQAQQAMQDAAKVVCAHQTSPRLPIFGLDADNKQAAVDGAEGALPNALAATTPGSMRYVACIGEEAKVQETAIHAVGIFIFDPDAPYETVPVLYQSIQYIWNVKLRQTDTGDEVDATIINGGDPPPLPSTTRAIYEGATNPIYFGTKPEFADLVDWLQTVLK